MYVNRGFPIKVIFRFSYYTILFFSIWSAIIVFLYKCYHIPYLAVPFLPISTIGTALGFYLGIKNSSAYDRLWEARKIWGGIVNESRAWASMLNGYISNNINSGVSIENVEHLRLDLVKRHIAWIYAHKFYLRNKIQSWEHNRPMNNEYRKKFQEDFSISTELRKDLKRYLSQDEITEIVDLANPAAQILNNQSKAIKHLREENIIEDFRMFEMQNHINKLFELQGKNERIKNFPFPRQYSWIVNMILAIFCLLLPLGLLNEMNKQGEVYIWLTVPFSALISWVFIFMSQNGDYSENPFQGLAFDVPITSMTRNIEIDMMQMLGQKETLNPILPKDGVIM